MIQKIDRWGNSLGLRLPKTVTQQLSLNEGSTVDIAIEKNLLVLRPQGKRKQSLKELLARISTQNTQKNITWGKPQGKEVW